METMENIPAKENGTINISDEVISIIASRAAEEVNGVAGMAVNTLSGGFAELLGKKDLSKGVKVDVNETEVAIDLSIIVEYGAKIPDVAWELQGKVKNDVESMTGMTVTAVNVTVDDVVLPKEEVKDSEEKQPEKSAEKKPAAKKTAAKKPAAKKAAPKADKADKEKE